MSATAVRALLAWCPDWPVVAAVQADAAGGAGVLDPIAVVHANRVVACSSAARAAGVAVGLRRRDAQGRCPTLVVVPTDEGRDAVWFEPVVAAVEQVAAGVAVVRPGVCAVAARGPASYFGGEQAAAERVVEQIAAETGVEAQVGIADGVFAAGLAARTGRVVPPGHTPSFLSALPVTALQRPALTDLLRRLGIRTLGDFARLPAADVFARFGVDGALAHRLAAGLDDRPLQVRQPPADLSAVGDFADEPIDRVDVGAFAARTLAIRLHERLTGHGLAATRLEISAVTADGQQLGRVWRHDGLLTAAAIADRARWQLDGWLTRRRLAAPIIRLTLTPHGLLRQGGLQQGLWGEPGEQDARARRAMHRVQGLLGPDAVLVGVQSGGRDPDQQVTLLPWGDEPIPARPVGPWPGALPGPHPTLSAHGEVQLFGADRRPVIVDTRLQLTAPPTEVHLPGKRVLGVRQWWGPWPVDERWWDPATARRAARLQLVLNDGTAVAVEQSNGSWRLTGIFD
jgi:protein ImuB